MNELYICRRNLSRPDFAELALTWGRLLRKGANPRIPLLSEEGARGWWANLLSISKRDRTLARLHRIAAGQQVGFKKGVDVAVQDAVGVAHFKFRSVVLDEAVGVQDVRPDLAAKIDVSL